MGFSELPNPQFIFGHSASMCGLNKKELLKKNKPNNTTIYSDEGYTSIHTEIDRKSRDYM
jgi:hypothetical protein